MSVVIIGGGHGGFQVAASLRQENYAGKVTLISAENLRPYHRPPLSKAYLKDGISDALQMRPASFYERNDIGLRLGMRIARVDRAARMVIPEQGDQIAYDHLVLATGACNALPPVRGLDLPGVFGLRDLKDAQRLRVAMAGAGHVAIIGGGFIGLEFAAVARAAGIGVTVIEAAPRLMARALSPQMSDRFAAIHRDMGAQLCLGRMAVAVAEAGDRAAGVILDDGTRIDAGLVLLAAGVVPNAGLARDAGLATGNGIIVDRHLRTSDPAIFALGDCAAFPCLRTDSPLRLESVQAATDQARAIARTITGRPVAYDALPWFWSDQGSHKLQIAGACLQGDEAVAVSDNIVIRFRAGHMSGAETIDAPGVHMAARKLLASGPGPLQADLAAAGYDLRALAKDMKETA